MPATFLFTLSHPSVFSCDWPLRCSSRVTGLSGPWSSLALTACYLHGDGWLRRCHALLLTTAEDRAHTWDTLPFLLYLLTPSFCSFLTVFSFSQLLLHAFLLSGSSWKKLLWGYMVDLCLFFCNDTCCKVCHWWMFVCVDVECFFPLVLTDVSLKNIKSMSLIYSDTLHLCVCLLSFACSPVYFLAFPFLHTHKCSHPLFLHP